MTTRRNKHAFIVEPDGEYLSGYRDSILKLYVKTLLAYINMILPHSEMH